MERKTFFFCVENYARKHTQKKEKFKFLKVLLFPFKRMHFSFRIYIFFQVSFMNSVFFGLKLGLSECHMRIENGCDENKC